MWGNPVRKANLDMAGVAEHVSEFEPQLAGSTHKWPSSDLANTAHKCSKSCHNWAPPPNHGRARIIIGQLRPTFLGQAWRLVALITERVRRFGMHDRRMLNASIGVGPQSDRACAFLYPHRSIHAGLVAVGAELKDGAAPFGEVDHVPHSAAVVCASPSAGCGTTSDFEGACESLLKAEHKLRLTEELLEVMGDGRGDEGRQERESRTRSIHLKVAQHGRVGKHSGSIGSPMTTQRWVSKMRERNASGRCTWNREGRVRRRLYRGR